MHISLPKPMNSVSSFDKPILTKWSGIIRNKDVTKLIAIKVFLFCASLDHSSHPSIIMLYKKGK
jgi:hypothetical protein